MKKFFMAIVLCLVCTVSFGQESKYVKTTSLNFVETGEDFIIARKLNGKNIAVFNCDTIPSQGMFLKMENDSTVLCNDSLSMCCFGLSIIRNKDGKYLTSNENPLHFSSIYEPSSIKFSDYFCIYNFHSDDTWGYSNYAYLLYKQSNNTFESSTFNSNCGYPTWGGHFTLEIYVKQEEDSSTTNINNITVKQNTIKCIKNGKLTIQTDGKTYDILGNQIY
jgi:hypothetical protein